MSSKLFGGILLIVGMTVGGAMLALPIATSEMGFINSSLSLLLFWFVMTASAFLILEVNLWFPANSNLISMAKATLGIWGAAVAWLSYLFLLYALLAAYVAAGGDFLQHLFSSVLPSIPAYVYSFLFTGLLGFVIYRGIQYVDYVNRGLMFGKLLLYSLLVASILPFISVDALFEGQIKYLATSASVIITSFGFAIIVPSLRAYFKDETSELRRAIFIGSLIPLFCYWLWNLAIMGLAPREGEYGLVTMLHTQYSVGHFMSVLSHLVSNRIITGLARLFTAICLTTSFLGVSLSLVDFLADGLPVKKLKTKQVVIYSLVFSPPLFIALYCPGVFITALSYAGVFCSFLLILLPAMMAWSGRYHKKIASGSSVPGGKFLLIALMGVSVFIMVSSLV